MELDGEVFSPLKKPYLLFAIQSCLSYQMGHSPNLDYPFKFNSEINTALSVLVDFSTTVFFTFRVFF